MARRRHPSERRPQPEHRRSKIAEVASANPGEKLTAIAEAVNSGKVHALLCLHEDATACGITAKALEGLSCLITLGLLPSETTAAATVVLPGAGFAEKRGSMINIKGRLQRLNRSINPPGQARDDWEVLRDLIQGINGSNGIYMVEDLFKSMASEVPEFAGLSLSKIGDLGVQIIHEEAGQGCAASPFRDSGRARLARSLLSTAGSASPVFQPPNTFGQPIRENILR